MNAKKEMEALIASELKEIEGGSASEGTCVCENGGAGETIIVIIDEPTHPGRRI